MNKQTPKVFAVLSLLVMLAVAPASATPISRLKADIPFDFTAGGTTFRAGVYKVAPTDKSGLLLIRGEDFRASAMVFANGMHSGKRPGQAKLIFRRYGDRYFLARVWFGGSGDGHDLPPSRLEREAARSAAGRLAQTAVEPEVICVAAQ